MRYELSDIQAANNVEDVKFLAGNSLAFAKLLRYAYSLYNEASLVLSQITEIENKSDKNLDDEIFEAKTRFTSQLTCVNRFLFLCKEANLLPAPVKRNRSRSSLKKLVYEKLYMESSNVGSARNVSDSY